METYKDCLKYDIIRNGEMLDKPVNFFVLALNRLGCETFFSCGGPPKGFYISFGCDYMTALKINKSGFFNIEVSSANNWIIRLNEQGHELNVGEFTDESRDAWLQSASESWIKNL